MGTNYYFMTRNKELAQNHFANVYDWGVVDKEYEIVDNPYLGYQIHLNKLSAGWRPLFQKHKAFNTWNQLEEFYMAHRDDLDIYDEYGQGFGFLKYREIIFDHADIDPQPYKWQYGIDPFDKIFSDNPNKRIFLDKCDPEEAEIWTPFDHVAYFNTEHNAKLRWGQNTFGYFPSDLHHWNDPDYPFDWTEGDFS